MNTNDPIVDAFRLTAATSTDILRKMTFKKWRQQIESNSLSSQFKLYWKVMSI